METTSPSAVWRLCIPRPAWMPHTATAEQDYSPEDGLVVRPGRPLPARFDALLGSSFRAAVITAVKVADLLCISGLRGELEEPAASRMEQVAIQRGEWDPGRIWATVTRQRVGGSARLSCYVWIEQAWSTDPVALMDWRDDLQAFQWQQFANIHARLVEVSQ